MNTYSKLKLDDLLHVLEAFAEIDSEPTRLERLESLLPTGLPWSVIAERSGYTVKSAKSKSIASRNGWVWGGRFRWINGASSPDRLAA